MTTKAIPIGCCRDCRFAEDVEADNMVSDQWPVECRGLPVTWVPRQGKGTMVDPKTGQPSTVVTMTRLPAWKRLDDHCAMWQPRPVGGDLPEGLGLGVIGGGRG
jgi:hypothetical protein